MNIPTHSRKRRDSGLASVTGSDSSKRSSKRVTFGEVTEIPPERRRSMYSNQLKTSDHLKQATNAVKRLSHPTSYHSSLSHELSRPSPPRDYYQSSYDRHNYRDSISASYRHVLPMKFQKSTPKYHAAPEITPFTTKRPDDTSLPPRSRSQQKPMAVRITYVVLGGRDSPTAGNRISVR